MTKGFFHANVHFVNTRDEKFDLNSLLLLDEISNNKDLTQRDLSNSLGVALGLVNSYLKTLISKGFITVTGIPRKRCTYYLTPNGFSEKARLTCQHLQNLTSLYKVARHDFGGLFSRLEASNIRRLAFCGVDEITEIAYISLKETGLELAAISDIAPVRKRFLGHGVIAVSELAKADFDLVVITSFLSGEAIKRALLDAGIAGDRICGVNVSGWLKRIEEARDQRAGA